MNELAPEAVQSRIDAHRRKEVRLRAIAPDGRPIPRATLHVEQTRHAFLFGCNLFLWQAKNSPVQEAYRERFKELMNYATLGFYWWDYERERGKPRYAYTDAVLDWTETNGIVCKGHPLVWNYAAARWYPKDLAELRRLSDERVRACVSRFAGRIDRWDVVNEATDPFRGGTFDNVFSDAWREYGRVAFTKHSFDVARAANPTATLLINDYRLDADYEALIEELKNDSGRPLYDVIGLQTHQHGGAIPPERLWDICERFARFGVPLHFTETTILSGARKERGFEETNPAGEAKQADEVERFYTTLFSHPSVEAITWWDFSDLRSWQAAPAGFVRADMSPKPAYDRLMSLVKGKWWTTANLRADEAGEAVLDGFYGDYRVTIRGDNGTSVERTFAIERDSGPVIELRA